jgi:hypothetical protein
MYIQHRCKICKAAIKTNFTGKKRQYCDKCREGQQNPFKEKALEKRKEKK